MDLLKILQGSRGIMRSLVIQFVCWLGWFSTFALAQFDISEGVTGSVNFPALAITCVGNLSVLVTSLIRGRLDLEMGARDVIDILSNPKLKEIRGIKHGLTTCIQEDVAIGGGGDQGTSSTARVPQTSSTEEHGVESASRRGPETASTEENVIRTASTERGGLQTVSTEETVVQVPIGSIEGEAGSEAAAAAIGGASTRKRGLQRACVIILSYGAPNWSMRQFIQSNAHVAHSIVLQYLPLRHAISDSEVREELSPRVNIKLCECRLPWCSCIVFWTGEEITSMLAHRMPGTLKRLSNSLCLLPCSTCLRKGCHECNRESLLRGLGQADEGHSVVSDILEDIYMGKRVLRQLEQVADSDVFHIPEYIYARKPICICIPVHDARGDDWTRLLVKTLRSKDAEGRGVRNMATEALEGYLAGSRGSEEGTVKYDIFSFVVPRLTEVLINLVVTFWFRVDGFSSALVAGRTVRDYLVDTKSSGYAANAFLSRAVVKSNGDNTRVCQALFFRGRDRLCIITFISVGCVNMICFLGWALIISFERGPDSSKSPSMPIVAVIISAIGSPWVVVAAAAAILGEAEDIFLFFSDITLPWFVKVLVTLIFVVISPVIFVVISPVILLGIAIVFSLTAVREREGALIGALIATGLLFEIVCFVSWSAVAATLGIKGFGRWLYGALQILVWVQWAIGSYFLNEENSIEFLGRNPDRAILIFYSSAFWLNAVLAGVRCNWEAAWPWEHNNLFSFISG